MIMLTEILIGLPLVLSILLKITIVLGIGWVLHLLLGGKKRRWRLLVWRSVVVAVFLVPLLVPLRYFRVSVPMPVEPMMETVSLSGDYVVGFDPLTSIEAESYSPGSYESEPVAQLPPDRQIVASPSFSLGIWVRQNLWTILFVVWYVVAALLTMRLLLLFMNVRKTIDSSVPVEKHLEGLLAEVASDLNSSQRILLRCSSEITSPFLAGLWRPVIIIPKRMVDSSRRYELPAVFAHEVAHLCNRDLFWMFAARLVSIVLWFHPLVWKLRDTHNAACEEVCDAIAADYVGNVESYSGTLARIALEIVGRVHAVGGVSMASSAEIIGRLRILKLRLCFGSLAWRWIVMSLLFACAGLVTFCGASLVYAEDSPEVVESKDESRQVLSKPGDEAKDNSVVDKLRKIWDLSEGEAIREISYSNSKYVVYTMLDQVLIHGYGQTMWCEGLALAGADGELLWEKKIGHTGQVFLGDKGTVAVAQWEFTEDQRQKHFPKKGDSIRIQLFDRNGKRIGGYSLGSHDWFFSSSIVIGGFMSSDERFSFVPLGRSKELICMHRDGKVLWRTPTKAGYTLMVSPNRDEVAVISGHGQNGRYYEIFDSYGKKIGDGNAKSGEDLVYENGAWEVKIVPPGREQMIKQLTDANLPIQPPAYAVKHEFMKGKTLEELIEGLGEMWSASFMLFGGVSSDWSNIASLAVYLPDNPRVIRIIEHGRRDPEKVGALVAADLERRIKRHPEVWRRYCEDTAEHPDHSLGFATSHKGEVIGSDSARQWEEDKYSISAAMWILVNIRYNKGIDSIWEFGLLMEHPDRHFTSPKMPGWEMDMFKGLCPQMAIYAVDALLKDNQDPAYDRERKAFSAIIKDLKLSEGTKRVKGSHALYPTTHVATEAGIDMSFEPWIDVDVPDEYVFNKKLSDSDITSMMKILSQAAKIRDPKLLVKMRWHGAAPLQEILPLYDESSLPQFYEILKDENISGYEAKMAVICIGLISKRGNKQTVKELLDYYKRSVDWDKWRHSEHEIDTQVFAKFDALDWLGFIGGNDVEGVLKQAMTVDGCKELAKEWLVDIPPTTFSVVDNLRGRAALGLAFSDKQEMQNLIKAEYEKERKACLDAGKTSGAYINNLTDAMARMDIVKDIGLEAHRKLYDGKGSYSYKYQVYIRKYLLFEAGPPVRKQP